MTYTPQQRAGFTNRARNAFRTTFGWRTTDVVRMLENGDPTNEIEEYLGESTGSIAAFKANVTRGTYDEFWHQNGDLFFLEDCNW